MIFNEKGPYFYATAMDREYVGNSSPEFVEGYQGGGPQLESPMRSDEITEPILTTGQIGQTVAEGKGQGTFIETVQGAIRKGAASVELSLSASGQEPGVGPDLYTKEKLQEIKDIAKANQIEIASVHVPAQVVGNISGFISPQQGFVEEQRFNQVNEVKKAVEFSANTSEGGAIVVHTGEFQRPMSEQDWSKGMGPDRQPLFKHYEEEPERFVSYLVDDRTGRVIQDVKRTQVVYEPDFWTAEDRGMVGQTDPKTGRVFQKYDWIDMENKWIDPNDDERLFERVPKWNSEKTEFQTKRLTWDDFEERAKIWNTEHANQIGRGDMDLKTAEEMFIKTQMETRALQYKGSSLYHGQRYEMYMEIRDKAKEALEFYETLEPNLTEDQKRNMMKQRGFGMTRAGQELIPSESISPVEALKREIEDAEHSMRYTHEASASADAQADSTMEDLGHMKTVASYAKGESTKSIAEAAVYAMDMTQNRKLEKAIFVAPENIFPEMGYGSHPDELIELVQCSRNKMAHQLMDKRGYSKEKARKLAEQHIKATFDTEHLGMWKKHFTKKHGETEEVFTERFNGWYMEQVKKMQDAGVIGHLHIADGFGYGHANLPAGQGNLPVVDAVTYLKKHGYEGAFLSEGYGDAQRMLRDTWRAFGTPLYSHSSAGSPGPGTRWNDVMHGYFGRNQPPFYTFGAYSPSNDWTLWSQTPME